MRLETGMPRRQTVASRESETRWATGFTRSPWCGCASMGSPIESHGLGSRWSIRPTDQIPHGWNMSHRQPTAVTCSRSRPVCGLKSARRRYWVSPGRTGSSAQTRNRDHARGFVTAVGAAGTVRSSGRSRTAGRRARRRGRVAGGSRSPPPGSGLRRAAPGWWRPASGCPARTELRP